MAQVEREADFSRINPVILEDEEMSDDCQKSADHSPQLPNGNVMPDKVAAYRKNAKSTLVKIRNAQKFIARIRDQMYELRKLTAKDKAKHYIGQSRKPGSLKPITLPKEHGFDKRSSLGNMASFVDGNTTQPNLLRQRMSRADLFARQSITGLTGSGNFPEVHNRKRIRKRRPDLGRKFKAAAWISILIRRLCLANLRNSEDSDSPYMKNIKFVDNMVRESQGNLLFSVEEFKANREMRMSEVSKHILIKPRWARTEQELLHVQIILRSIKDYADYPVAIQRKIAEVGEYLKYESRRIIVREGHPAWNFYFILSGSVVVLVMDEDRAFVKPKAILRKGQSFGELAIIHGDKRRSTVVAMEETEMLSIWFEDYEAIFMDGGVSKADDEFVKELNFLQGWPIEIADDHSDLFRYYFYKRGEIVVRDSNRSNWIIVVKSGSLKVMKRLRKVEAFEWRKNPAENKAVETGEGLEKAVDSLTLANMDAVMTKTTINQKFKTLDRKHFKRKSTKSHLNSVELSLSNVKEIESLDSTSFHQEILTASNDLDMGYQRSEREVDTDTEMNPMFVHIQTLTKGQVFGLYEIVLGKQPSFCVVSNGAEVIMIDKNFYAEHMKDETMKRVRQEAQAYPSDSELQSNLQVTVDWDAYKIATLKSAVRRNPRISRNLCK